MLAERPTSPRQRKRAPQVEVEDSQQTLVVDAAPETTSAPRSTRSPRPRRTNAAGATDTSDASEAASPTSRATAIIPAASAPRAPRPARSAGSSGLSTTSGRMRATRVTGSASASNPSSPSSASSGRRQKVTARPLDTGDTQIVEQATWMIRALTVLEQPAEPPALIDPPQSPALITEPDAARDVTIVGGDATSSMVALRMTPPPRKLRHWASGLVILALIAAVTVTAIATVTPLATGHAEGLAVNAAGPLGLPVALDSANQPPSGHWVAVIGMQPNQDVGGGAGPGVKAPGSAGLPVSSVKTTVDTAPPASPSTFSAAGVSAPPMYPWPPTNAYAAVPGYYAFGMYDVGGFYSWAFGQCTWWAQYERRDENLMHMGNAQYWASDASARGYSVGWQPRAGATVVFQPGVQGAGGAGHVAHVVKVYPDDWFLVSEMNFYWNGGGWGRVDYRFAHAGSGVEFIY